MISSSSLIPTDADAPLFFSWQQSPQAAMMLRSASPHAVGTCATKPTRMKTLLIVDDELKVCEFLARFFASRGFQTRVACSGQDAITQLSRESPDYLLLDIRMPDMSGLEVLELAKSLCPEVRVIMATAVEDEDIVEKAFRLGASGYVTKPFSADDTTWARIFFEELDDSSEEGGLTHS